MEVKGGARLLDEKTIRWLVGGGLLLTLLGIFAFALRWKFTNRSRSIIPPPRRHRFVPWSGSELAGSLVVYVIVQIIASLIGSAVSGMPVDPTREPQPMHGVYLVRFMLAVTIVAPLTIVAIPLLLRWGSQTKLRHLGVSSWRWKENVVLATICYLIITPLVYGLTLVASWATREIGDKPKSHPLMQLVADGEWPLAWLLVVIQAVVLAPIVEELLFRGVMLKWLSKRRWGGWVAMAGGIAIGLNFLVSSLINRSPETPIVWAPLGFSLLASALGILFTWPRAPEQWERRAIIGTSILFAMFHAHVWPTPIPLLVLGLALGWMTHRTRSLIGPILFHAMFNATTTILLAAGFQSDSTAPVVPPVKQKEERSAHRIHSPPPFALRPPCPAPDVRAADNPAR